jgi:TIR domain-containing protein
MAVCTIFVSHSTDFALPKDQNLPWIVLETLVDRLEASGRFRAVWDRGSLEPGTDWRGEIETWMDTCDAAVVLVSERTLQSDYVAYEAGRLSDRQRKDPSFLLIPALIAPVDPARVRARFNPQRLSERTWVTGDTGELVDGIVDRLRVVTCPPPPLRRRAARLSTLLHGVTRPAVAEAVRKVNPALGALPGDEEALRMRFAIELAGAGMAPASVEAIQYCKTHHAPPDGLTSELLEEIARLVAASWVELPTAGEIVAVVREEPNSRALGLNARQVLVGEIHVLSARYSDERESWQITTANGLTDEIDAGTAAGLIEQVRKALDGRLASPGTTLEEALDDLHWLGEPVVVVLPDLGIGPEELAALRKAFPRVRFLLLTGQPTRARNWMGVAEIRLLPDLPGDEDAFCNEYRRFTRLVTFPTRPAGPTS